MVSLDYRLKFDHLIEEFNFPSHEDVELCSTFDEGRVESHEPGIIVKRLQSVEVDDLKIQTGDDLMQFDCFPCGFPCCHGSYQGWAPLFV